jgi:integrase
MAKRYLDLMSGATAWGYKKGYCENVGDKKLLDINIKHTSKRQPGWEYHKLPLLWQLLCGAETECQHDGWLTTAQAAKAAGVERYAILNLIKYRKLPAQEARVNGILTYIINPIDLLNCFPHANVNVEPTFGAKHLAIPALKLLLLTMTRFNEVNLMRLGEINWERKVWTIPAERTKSKRVHVVPLVDPALEILENGRARQPANAGDESYMFAQGRPLTGVGFRFGLPLSDGVALKHLKLISGDPEITIHSFRRGGGSWTESQFVNLGGTWHTKYDIKFSRAVLGHATSNGLDYVYRADANFEVPCRALLTDWTDFIIHGPSGQPSEQPSVKQQTAEIVELTTRRAAGA